MLPTPSVLPRVRLGGGGLAAVLVAMTLLGVVATAPAAAQETESSTTTAPPTTAPPTTVTSTTETPVTVTSTTVTSTTVTSTPTTVPTSTSSPASTTSTLPSSTTSSTTDGGLDDHADDDHSDHAHCAPDDTDPASASPDTTVVDASSTTPAGVGSCVPAFDPDDPGAGESPTAAVPDVTVVVPKRSGGYANQPDFEPNQVIWSSVRVAEAKLDDAEAAHREAVATVKAVRLRLKELRFEQDGLAEETRELLAALRAAEELLEQRALQAFLEGDALDRIPTLDKDAAEVARIQQTMMSTVLDWDQALIEEMRSIRKQLTAEDERLHERTRLMERLLISSIERVSERRADIAAARLEFRTFEAGSEIFIPEVVFPIQWPYDQPLIDSWGFERAPGTPDAHWHEGIDLFAPYGTPLLATERGVISRIGNGRLGGLTIWLHGESGTDWYYAHLASIEAGLQVGDLVEGGDVIGTVGDSGNARGTPPHLHMQVHPGGGRPVNPYPMLWVRSEIDAEIRQVETTLLTLAE